MNTLLKADLDNFSRREFLKLTGASLSALFLMPILEHWPQQKARFDSEPLQASQGRILNNQATLYDKPSFSGKVLKVFYYDLVVPITRITIGDTQPSYNRIWYEIEHNGFVHSGSVQPVDVHPVAPLRMLPETELLTEVCVPYTEALWGLKRKSVAYRLYYSTTHWISGVTEDQEGKIWYHVKDDKWGFIYYVDARHLKIVSAADLAPISPEIPPEKKRIEIRLADQVLMAYEDRDVVFITRTATGARFRDGDFSTRPGHYQTNRKRPSRHMAAGDRAAPNSYDLPGVPWVSYLTQNGVAIHGTYWHNDFGRPRSHGCINVSSTASRWLYRWTMPSVPNNTDYWSEDSGTDVEAV